MGVALLGLSASDAARDWPTGEVVQGVFRTGESAVTRHENVGYAGLRHSPTIVNQVQRTFNGLGQLTNEYQSHSGAVVIGTTPQVQYSYSMMGFMQLAWQTFREGRHI